MKGFLSTKVKGWIQEKIADPEKLKTKSNTPRRFRNRIETEDLFQIVCSSIRFSSKVSKNQLQQSLSNLAFTIK